MGSLQQLHTFKPNNLKNMVGMAVSFKDRFPLLFDRPRYDLVVFVKRLADYYPELMQELTAMSGGRDRVVREVLWNYHLIAQWMSFGLPAFKLSPDMLAALTLTDPSDVEVEQVQLPFPCFTIIVPKNFWLVSAEGMFKPNMFGVSEYPQEHGCISIIGVNACQAPYDSTGRSHGTLSIHAFCDNGVALWDRVKWKPAGDKIGNWPSFGLLEEAEHYNIHDGEISIEERGIQHAIRKLVLNLALLVSERGKGIREGRITPKKRKGKRAAKQMQAVLPNVWVVGQSVKLSPQLIQLAQDADGSGRNKGLWKVAVRSMTRGHWRNQACGPARKLRKRIWIEPFWRGPKDGPKLTHLYED